MENKKTESTTHQTVPGDIWDQAAFELVYYKPRPLADIVALSNIARQLARVLDAYEGQNPLFSCQGQGMDSYSALAEFEAIAKDARELLREAKQRE